MAGSPAMTEKPAMHDIRAIRDNPEAFDKALARRGLAPLSPSLLALDETRRAAIAAAEQAQARRNAASKEIGEAKKNKDNARADALMAEVAGPQVKLRSSKPREGSTRTQRAQGGRADSQPPPPPPPHAEDVPVRASRQTSSTPLRRQARYAFTRRSMSRSARAWRHGLRGGGETVRRALVVLKKGLARARAPYGQFFLGAPPSTATRRSTAILVRDDAMFGTAHAAEVRG